MSVVLDHCVDVLAAGDRPTPCQRVDPELFFADAPATIEFAKSLCGPCPVRAACLAGALERGEAAGVWGGELICAGSIVARKRARGRPRKHPLPAPPAEDPPVLATRAA